MPELVERCGVGTVVPPGNPEALGAAMVDFAAERFDPGVTAEGLREVYQRHYTQERMAERYEELYLRLRKG